VNRWHAVTSLLAADWRQIRWTLDCWGCSGRWALARNSTSLRQKKFVKFGGDVAEGAEDEVALTMAYDIPSHPPVAQDTNASRTPVTGSTAAYPARNASS
jgi:hypothetical protein